MYYCWLFLREVAGIWYVLLILSRMFTSLFHLLLAQVHDQYVEKTLENRRFGAAKITDVVKKLQIKQLFSSKNTGKSYKGRDIFLLQTGAGKTKILLWSQMHGDEATATMALCDIFQFLSADATDLPAPLVGFRDFIQAHTTLYFVPMLNPDGAEAFERRTAQGIDMNRDALRLQCPESQILKQLQTELQPDFGFNLHDQDIRYAAGKSPYPATISFLAPPIDAQQTVNDVRKRAMQVIVQLTRHLQDIIPHQIGRWSDDFEPRAFGENMQQWGTSTILVESGGYTNDTEKQFIRKLNFVLLLDAFYQIASQSYVHEPLEPYYDIPHNEKIFFDLLIRNVQRNGYRVDVGINRAEKTIFSPEGNSFYYNSSIEDCGDLQGFYGYEEWDASALELVEGKIHPESLILWKDREKYDIWALLRQGYTCMRCQEQANETQAGQESPFWYILPTNDWDTQVGEGKKANFLLTQNGQFRYVVCNGFLYDLQTQQKLQPFRENLMSK